jgi:hypothetical protein
MTTPANTTLGLFKTQNPVGSIFPIYRNSVPGEEHKCERTPCHNNDAGRAAAYEIANRKDFVCWAIDPWTSQINLVLSPPQ